jgi:hypothetical protein
MQNEYLSNSDSGESEPGFTSQPMNAGFTITPQDIDILQQYLEEFQEADTSLRTKIIEKVMAELYQLRPTNTHFDKKEASKVYRIYMHQCIYSSLHDSENTEVVL